MRRVLRSPYNWIINIRISETLFYKGGFCLSPNSEPPTVNIINPCRVIPNSTGETEKKRKTSSHTKPVHSKCCSVTWEFRVMFVSFFIYDSEFLDKWLGSGLRLCIGKSCERDQAILYLGFLFDIRIS